MKLLDLIEAAKPITYDRTKYYKKGFWLYSKEWDVAKIFLADGWGEKVAKKFNAKFHKDFTVGGETPLVSGLSPDMEQKIAQYISTSKFHTATASYGKKGTSSVRKPGIATRAQIKYIAKDTLDKLLYIPSEGVIYIGKS